MPFHRLGLMSKRYGSIWRLAQALLPTGKLVLLVMDETLPIAMFGVFGLLCFVGLDDLTIELATSKITKFG